jgi:hypothetical protein
MRPQGSPPTGLRSSARLIPSQARKRASTGCLFRFLGKQPLLENKGGSSDFRARALQRLQSRNPLADLLDVGLSIDLALVAGWTANPQALPAPRARHRRTLAERGLFTRTDDTAEKRSATHQAISARCRRSGGSSPILSPNLPLTGASHSARKRLRSHSQLERGLLSQDFCLEIFGSK